MAACANEPSEPPVVAASDPMPAPQDFQQPAVTVGGTAAGNYLAGRHAHRLRDFDSAARYMSQALKDDPKNRTLMRHVYEVLLADGRIPEATILGRQLQEAGLNAPFVPLGLAVEDFKKGDYQAADKRLADLRRTGLNTFMVPLMRAWAKAGLGQYDDALKSLEPLGQLTGFGILHDLHTGLIYDVAGNLDKAIEYYEAAERANARSSLRLVEALGSAYERAGQAAKAEALYHKYITENPDSVVLEPRLDGIKRGVAAKPLVPAARDGAAEAFFNVAGTLTRENTAEIALIWARLALYLRPDLDIARMLIAGILEAQGREVDALALYDQVKPGTPLHWLARLRSAANLDSIGRTDDAIDELRRMADEVTTRNDALISLGDLLRSKERFVESAEAYDAAIARIKEPSRRHWSLFYSRGIALERSKQWARAEADFLKALELQPDQPYVLNYLGYSWVDQGINLDRARKMIERAVELRPTDGYIVDSLGWVFYRLGDYGKAVEKLERAVELHPEDPVINDHLGDAYWKVGRVKEANVQWQRALSFKPDKDVEAAIRAKLERGLVDNRHKKSNSDG